MNIKKLGILLLTVLMLINLVGCGNKEEEEETEQNTGTKSNSEEVSKKNYKWVVEPTIEAESIYPCNDKYSRIMIDGRTTLIDYAGETIKLPEKYVDISVGLSSEYEVASSSSYEMLSDVIGEQEVLVAMDSGYNLYYLDENFREVTRLNSTPVESFNFNFFNFCWDKESLTLYVESYQTGNLDEYHNSSYFENQNINLLRVLEITKKADEYQEGEYKIATQGKYGFLNVKRNSIAIGFKYDSALQFKDGYAAVCIDDKCGLIDEAGETYIDFEFEDIVESFNGLAWVKFEGKWGVIKIL